jgi:hypothetical protein
MACLPITWEPDTFKLFYFTGLPSSGKHFSQVSFSSEADHIIFLGGALTHEFGSAPRGEFIAGITTIDRSGNMLVPAR